MLEHTFVRTGVIARLRRSPLGPYLDSLDTALHRDGYAPSSIQRFLCAAEQFAHWVHRQGYTISEMDADLVHRYLSTLPRYRSGNLPKAAQGLKYLVRFLHQHGIACPRRPRPPTPPLEQWLSVYDTHLTQVAGLARSTRQTYGHLVRRFLIACFGMTTPDWPSITATMITTFVSKEAAMRHNAGRKLPKALAP
jgi:hypothetical protein